MSLSEITQFKSKVSEIADTEDERVFITGNDRCIIFFGAEFCGHCIAMITVVDDMCKKYPSIAFAHVETTKVKCASVSGTPVFVCYKKGKPVHVVLGADPQGLTSVITTKLLKD